MSQEQYYQTVQQGEEYFQDELKKLEIELEYYEFQKYSAKSNLEKSKLDVEYYQWQVQVFEKEIERIKKIINKVKELS